MTVLMNKTTSINVLTLIPARSGSKGVPNKNIRDFLGKPLIAHSIEIASKSRLAGRILVSTDDQKIACMAKEMGAEAPFLRPTEIATDQSPVIDTALHALNWLESNDGWRPEWLLLLQPTSPLRTSEDIHHAFALVQSSNADAVVAVTEPKIHPLWVKSVDVQGFLCPYVAETVAPLRRQDLPPALALSGLLYLVRVSVLRNEGVFCPKRTLPLMIPASRAIDIDSELDFLLAEYSGRMNIK